MSTRSLITLRTPRSRAVLWSLAMLWNLSGAALGRHQPLFVAVGLLAALFFGWFAARVLFDVTTATFEGGTFRVSTRPLPPFRRFEHPLVDIHAFVADVDDQHEHEGHAVFLITRGSAKRLRLPLPLAGAQLHAKGATHPMLNTVTRERAAAIAAQLDALLDDARRASSGYRVVESMVVTADTPETEERQLPGRSAGS
jgi:hypothetical protein